MKRQHLIFFTVANLPLVITSVDKPNTLKALCTLTPAKGLTNRFHFAVRLHSDNAQMTSKHGKNKEVRYEPQASSVTDVLTMF